MDKYAGKKAGGTGGTQGTGLAMVEALLASLLLDGFELLGVERAPIGPSGVLGALAVVAGKGRPGVHAQVLAWGMLPSCSREKTGLPTAPKRQPGILANFVPRSPAG